MINTKNLGSGFKVPYYIALNKDKDFTFTNKLYVDENPLHIGEYRQAFEDSNLILNMGYTEGYKNTNSKKISGEKSHFFSKFTKNFSKNNDSETNITIQTQDVSNDKYLKLYKIDSNLVDYEQVIWKILSIFSHEQWLFLSVDASIYETLKETYNDKYEYIFPDILFDKNLFQSQQAGILDLQSNLKINNYDTNKTSKMFINDFNWKSKDYNHKNGLISKFIGNIKNVNFDTKNISEFKETKTNEIHGAIGYLSELELIKKTKFKFSELIDSKLLVRYAPGSMRKEIEGSRLTTDNAFTLDRSNQSYNLKKVWALQ